MTTVDQIVAWDFFVATAAPVVFVIVYLFTDWYKTWEGRVIMLKQVLWIGFLINGVLYFAIGEDYPGRDAYRLLLFTTLVIALWGMTILLIVRQAQGRAERRALADQQPSQETRPAPVEDHQLG